MKNYVFHITINDQNFKKDRPVFLFKLVFEIRFSDALLATEVMVKLNFHWPSNNTKKYVNNYQRKNYK